MKITRLQATKVHGYLPLDVEFFDDLTFLTGLNGSGKTSALRLLMALLTPNIDELGSIAFATANVTVRDEATETVIGAVKTPDAVTISVSAIEQTLQITSADLEIDMEAPGFPVHKGNVYAYVPRSRSAILPTRNN
jgi:predicted ATP-binding protein involved in virulence